MTCQISQVSKKLKKIVLFFIISISILKVHAVRGGLDPSHRHQVTPSLNPWYPKTYHLIQNYLIIYFPYMLT